MNSHANGYLSLTKEGIIYNGEKTVSSISGAVEIRQLHENEGN